MSLLLSDSENKSKKCNGIFTIKRLSDEIKTRDKLFSMKRKRVKEKEKKMMRKTSVNGE